MWNNICSFHAKGQTTSAKYYPEVILRGKKTERVPSKTGTGKDVLLFLDNAPSYAASSTVDFHSFPELKNIRWNQTEHSLRTRFSINNRCYYVLSCCEYFPASERFQN